MLFYTTSLGPSVGDPTAIYTPPLRYKREEYVKPSKTREEKPDTTQAWIHSEQFRSQPLESRSNTTHSGRRVLRSSGPNHSKPVVFIVFLYLDRTDPSYPLSTHPLGLGGCTTPLGCGFAHHECAIFLNSIHVLVDPDVKFGSFIHVLVSKCWPHLLGFTGKC